MANILKLKRSAVPNRVPQTADLDLGELAINTYDGKLYLKKDNGTASIVDVTGGGGTTSSALIFTGMDGGSASTTVFDFTLDLADAYVQ